MAANTGITKFILDKKKDFVFFLLTNDTLIAAIRKFHLLHKEDVNSFAKPKTKPSDLDKKIGILCTQSIELKRLCNKFLFDRVKRKRLSFVEKEWVINQISSFNSLRVKHNQQGMYKAYLAYFYPNHKRNVGIDNELKSINDIPTNEKGLTIFIEKLTKPIRYNHFINEYNYLVSEANVLFSNEVINRIADIQASELILSNISNEIMQILVLTQGQQFGTPIDGSQTISDLNDRLYRLYQMYAEIEAKALKQAKEIKEAKALKEQSSTDLSTGQDVKKLYTKDGYRMKMIKERKMKMTKVKNRDSQINVNRRFGIIEAYVPTEDVNAFLTKPIYWNDNELNGLIYMNYGKHLRDFYDGKIPKHIAITKIKFGYRVVVEVCPSVALNMAKQVIFERERRKITKEEIAEEKGYFKNIVLPKFETKHKELLEYLKDF